MVDPHLCLDPAVVGRLSGNVPISAIGHLLHDGRKEAKEEKETKETKEAKKANAANNQLIRSSVNHSVK